MTESVFFQPVLLHSNEMQSDRAIRISAITSPASEMQSMYDNFEKGAEEAAETNLWSNLVIIASAIKWMNTQMSW